MFLDWEAAVLPLNYARELMQLNPAPFYRPPPRRAAS
jgi:hypothetical protein